MASTTQVSSAEPYTAFTAAAVQQPAQVLYERGNIKVTDSGLELKCYYFPTGQKKFVQWRDVTDLESKKVNLGNCKTWGMALDFKVPNSMQIAVEISLKSLRTLSRGPNAL